ncbi:hypothetical protein PI124_g21030 [Phytophthora idaei]|nr:hypothetical protein PI125_g25822 [Phytophthora idaei]KAG3123813.1 hypothetical protein PI126_g23539 [Phytophthora idaei]KAG3233907.1 hypothetical protein PI124_g21030 [Phytophthora idaei]
MPPSGSDRPERSTPKHKSSLPSQFKSSLLAEQESASDSDVLGLKSDVVGISLSDEASRPPAAPSGDDYEEKSEEVMIDPPAEGSQSSGMVLSVVP